MSAMRFLETPLIDLHGLHVLQRYKGFLVYLDTSEAIQGFKALGRLCLSIASRRSQEQWRSGDDLWPHSFHAKFVDFAMQYLRASFILDAFLAGCDLVCLGFRDAKNSSRTYNADVDDPESFNF